MVLCLIKILRNRFILVFESYFVAGLCHFGCHVAHVLHPEITVYSRKCMWEMFEYTLKRYRKEGIGLDWLTVGVGQK